MMKLENANIVEKNLDQANIAKGELAQEHASIRLIKVKSIKPIGRHDVYNMEVDKYHNFSVNGGIIVHNCIDSIRYATERAAGWTGNDYSRVKMPLAGVM